MQSGKELSLSKHHGLGNDFLVLLDMTGSIFLTLPEIRGLLDRRMGVGADGLIHVTRAKPDSNSVAAMALYNSDGSSAEMSGNGVRCLAQALVDAGHAPAGRFFITTGAGDIEIESYCNPGEVVSEISVAIGMPGVLTVGERSIAGQRFRQVRVDIGNPHLVLFGDSSFGEDDLVGLDLTDLGPKIEDEFPSGMNIEWIVSKWGIDEILLRVWERGAGITSACGTGSTAAAFAAHHLGIVGRTVTVKNPGGILSVSIGDETCYLRGPAQKVCDVVVTSSQLNAMAAQVK